MRLNVRSFVFPVAFAALAVATPARAQVFLDLSSVTSGAAGTFTGALGGITVNGTLTNSTGTTVLSAVNNASTGFSDSTTNNTNAQYSYAGIYSPTIALTDRVGYAVFAAAPGVNRGTITMTLSAPVTNPRFHIANLDAAIFDFSPTPGLGGLVLLSGNGGGGDGLALSGLTLIDQNTAGVGVSTNTPPPTTGNRSAYGTVQITGTFTTIAFNTFSTGGVGDGGSFTVSVASAAPEPGTLALVALGVSLLSSRAARRRG